MGEAEQVAVGPAIALLILHRLVSEVVRLTADIPATHGVAQTAAPAAQSIHILGEVEQVRADAADLAQALENQRLGFAVAVCGHQREGEDGRVVLRRAAGSLISTMRFSARTPSAWMQRTSASWFCFTSSRSPM